MLIKTISLDIYSNLKYRKCSNNGISEQFNNVLIEHPRGNIDTDSNNLPPNFCRVITRNIGGIEYKHIEPNTPVKRGYVGYMSGGSYAGSSDGRFSEISHYPLAIHDRQETQEQYDQMSH
jgi:hypothetical protein